MESFLWYMIIIFIPAGIGRKFNVQKTFRRRPGHLLNVLCTFKYVLCLRGYEHGSKHVSEEYICNLSNCSTQFSILTINGIFDEVN